MFDNFSTESLTGAATAVVTGIASAIFLLRKKVSADNTDIRRDRAEQNIIEYLERQRDRAVVDKEVAIEKLQHAIAERDLAVQKVSKLTSEVENLSGQVKILRELVERLGVSLEDTRTQLNNYVAENVRLLARLEANNERDQ